MTRPGELPPYRVIDAALRAATTRLVGEVVAPRDAAPDWNDFEWGVARAVCALQGISGLLKTRLRWTGPDHWQQFLDDQRFHLLRRHEQIGELLARLHTGLREAGVPGVALKGSALHALGIHAPGERPQADIDLLVDPRHLPACGKALARLDYELLFATRRHEVYAPVNRQSPRPFAEHSDNPLKIEVHTSVSETLPVETVDITHGILADGMPAGINPYPNPGALLRHVSLHAAGAMRANASRFMQVLDVAQLARRMNAADWRDLRDWWLFPPLSLAARHLPGSVPAPVLAELASICPRRLRQRYETVSLYEVTWSNLRIAALPGAEWSRTLRDRLRFARSRIWPDRTSLDELDTTRLSQPRLMQERWYGVSHLERIARWVFGHPPRVQTISAVAEALRPMAPRA